MNIDEGQDFEIVGDRAWVFERDEKGTIMRKRFVGYFVRANYETVFVCPRKPNDKMEIRHGWGLCAELLDWMIKNGITRIYIKLPERILESRMSRWIAHRIGPETYPPFEPQFFLPEKYFDGKEEDGSDPHDLRNYF